VTSGIASNRFGRVILPLLLQPLLAIAVASAQVGQTLVPSPAEFLGYPLGAKFTTHGDIRDYFRELAGASERLEYAAYGTTTEGRVLIQVAIATPEHLERLEEILRLNAELTEAGTSEARAREIAASNPAVVYFSYGVHGNEASASDAAIWTVYDLLTDAPEVSGALDSLVVIIDPVTNPDGRERYVQWYRSVVGAKPNADPQSREHREPWPGGRYNHYLFDLNRDWAWMTQAETRSRIATWWRWNPQVHVDFHEMGPNSTYFFFPAAAPINPIYPGHVREWWGRFADRNARAFDVRGWTYFTEESFDMLYPGYGDTWPSLHGAIGMTYEQAGGGAAGLAYERDRDTLTLAMRISQHRTTGSATLRSAAAGKTRLLLDFATAHRTAGEGNPDILLVPGADPQRLNALVDHLLAQGIEVERSAGPRRVSATPYPGYEIRRDFPTGTVRVRARQPRGRLAVTLLQPNTELRAEYSYDISSWSLPYAYGVEAHQAQGGTGSDWTAATTSLPPVDEVAPATGYGYLVAPWDRSAAGVVRYLTSGGIVRVLARPSTLGGRVWPAGSWFIPVGAAGAAAIEAAGLGGMVTPVEGGLSESGIDLGSASARTVRLPRVGLIGGDGVAAESFGAHWFHLEQEVGLGADAILLEELTDLDLARYDVIVLPDVTVPELDSDLLEILGEWVRSGGRLVAVAKGAEVVAGVGEVSLRQPRQDEDDEDAALDRLLATREERERREWREGIPGVILPVRLDAGHPLAWGASSDGSADRLFVLHQEGRAFEPMSGAEAVGLFGSELRAVSGAVTPERLERLERSVWLLTMPIGRGNLTLFADDPLFRLFWHATKPLYLNALLYGGM
jgi:hypothetical protein